MQIEDVVVTALKRGDDLQRTPASVTALSAEALETRRIQSVEDLAHGVPNLAFVKVGGVVPNLSIRGVSADGNTPTMDGTVALHVDGVYQPRANSLELALVDLQAVEVLRGPQGTLYGRNANAGVVSLVTARPAATFGGAAIATLGDYGRVGFRGHVTGPVTPTLAFRLSGLWDELGGYGRNLLSGSRLDGYEVLGARAALRWTPRETLTIDLIGSLARRTSNQPFYIANPYGAQEGSNYNRLVAGGADGRLSLKPHEVYNNFEPEQSTRHGAATLIVDWRVGSGVSIRSITGYQDDDFRSLQDHDGTPTPWIVADQHATSTSLSQEFNANLSLGRARVVTGVYYLDDHIDGGAVIEIPPGNPFQAGAPTNLLTTALISQTSLSTAVFADLTWPVTDWLRVTAGVRRSRDERRSVQRIQAAVGASFSTPGVPVSGCTLDHPVPDVVYGSTTGKIGLEVDVAPVVMGYVTRQTGFKSGGYSSTVCDNRFLPEEVTSWEAGLKGRYLDGRLRLNLAAFRYDYTNMQLLRSFNPTPTTISSIIDNAASAKIHGAELEAVAMIGEAWRADLAIGYVDSEYGPLEARNGAVPGNPSFVLTGNRLPRSPEWTINAALEHTLPLSSYGQVTFRAGYNYISETFFTPFNEAIARQDGYGLVDLSARFEPAGGRLALTLFARNLTDEAYYSGLFTSAIAHNGRGSWGAPRTVGLELRTDF